MTREEAIEMLKSKMDGSVDTSYEWAETVRMAIEALSAEAEIDDLIIKGAKGIQDGLYNIKDGKLFKYKANGGTVRTYPIVPSTEVVSREDCDQCKIDRVGVLEQQLAELRGDYETLNKAYNDALADKPQSKWIDVNGDGSLWRCDQCKDTACCKGNYCTNCGADMRGNTE